MPWLVRVGPYRNQSCLVPWPFRDQVQNLSVLFPLLGSNLAQRDIPGHAVWIRRKWRQSLRRLKLKVGRPPRNVPLDDPRVLQKPPGSVRPSQRSPS